MAMIDVQGYAVQPLQVTHISPVTDETVGVTAHVRFFTSGGLDVRFSGTPAACAAKRAEVLAAINAA